MAPSVGKVSTGFQLGGLHGGLGSPFNSNPLNSSPAQAFNPMNPQSSNVAAAAGAGLGGMVVFHITQKDCVAPPACEQVKQCMAEAAKKAFMGSAIMGAAASTSDDNQPPEAAMAMPPEGQCSPCRLSWLAGDIRDVAARSFWIFPAGRPESTLNCTCPGKPSGDCGRRDR
eukprot:s293_g2.t1